MTETSQDYRAFWLSVIRRTQEEAEGKYSHWDSDPEKTIRAAKKWLTRLSVGLCEVCSYAGFTPDMTRRLVEDSRKRYGKVYSGNN